MAALKPEDKRRTFERLGNVREIVFGIQDGVLTTAGVLAGLSGAVSNRAQVILAALASTAAGALSMGAGAYLGTRAETQVLRNELKRVRRESERQPYLVQEELLAALAREGLSREAGYRVVQLLSRVPAALFSTAEQKLYGLSDAAFGNAIVDGLLMGVAFLAGALVLFAVGYIFEGLLAGERSPAVAGLRFLAIALSAAAIGYVIGLLIAPIGASAVG